MISDSVKSAEIAILFRLRVAGLELLTWLCRANAMTPQLHIELEFLSKCDFLRSRIIVIREWLIGCGLLDDVKEVSVDDGHRRGLHYGYVLDGPVAKDDCGYGHRNITIGMYVPVKSRNVHSV